jgi:cAMP-binding proteins - catabolite gene activator and regulatory subunit of cAMP-dependent protein kinases
MMVKSRSRVLTRPPPDERSPNKLLAALPAADYRRILPTLTTVPLKFRQVMHKYGEPIDTVYFIGGGVASVTNVMTDGRMVEVATIGNEGMVGVTVFLGGTLSPGEAFIQVPDGNGQAMPADAFRKELDRRGAFYGLMSRYSQAMQILIMQSTACNSLHTVEERCSRWLLMTHDRVDGDELRLTHEFLGYMLGVRRPTVSLVLGTLDKAGILHNGTKKITIVNRARLEDTSCECYRVVKSAFDRLLP